MNLTICNISIRQDDQGRYCLNDLHKAAGGFKRDQPSDWMRTKQAQELLSELEEELNTPGIPGISPLMAIPGRKGGTFVVKELIYAYAMWISAAFHLKVIRAYHAMVTGGQYLHALYAAKRAEIEVHRLDAAKCGRGLRDWRFWIKPKESELALLEAQIQPSLFMA